MDQIDLDLLQTVPVYHVQALIKTRHLPLSPLAFNSGSSPGTSSPSSSTPAAISELAQHLFDPVAILEVIQSLDEFEHRLLRELVACGGRANSRDLALYFTNADLLAGSKKNEAPRPSLEAARMPPPGTQIQAPQYPVAHPHGVFEQALRHLLTFGLLFWGKQTNFAGRDYTSGIHDGVLITPLAVKDVVLQAWGQEDAVPLPADSDVGEGALALQRALYLYWSLAVAQREGLALVNNGLLSRSALRHLLEHMAVYSKSIGNGESEQARSESDAPHLLFLRFLLLQLGLLQVRHNALYALPAEEFFSLPLVERVRRCYRLYLETPFWNELLYLPEVNVRPGPAPLEPAHEEVMRARQTVLERVTHEHGGERIDLSAFIARTKLYAPNLLFPRHYGSRAERYSSSSNPYGWDFRLRRGWLTHREGWHLVEGGFIRAIVTGPLQWLGIVEFRPQEDPQAFFVSTAAPLIMGTTAPADEEIPLGRLIVQPNFELVALAPVSELLLISLDRFADRINLELIAQYRITRASMTRAIQHGLHAEAIQVLLERAAGSEIPQNVRYSLVEWERQARRIEIWQRATLLEVDDVALLDALFADPDVRPLFGRRLSPTLAEVVPRQLHAVQEILWQRNYLPALTNAIASDTSADSALHVREPQWRLHDDGLLQPFYAVSDLYLLAEVERFSERDEATSWYRLTTASVQRALAQGMTLDYLLRFLRQYCEGGIPGSLLIRLKLWGGGYAEQHIAVEHAPLLRLSSEVLRDLQSDEELKTLLGSEVEQPARLVQVESQHLARVLELLHERGFSLEE